MKNVLRSSLDLSSFSLPGRLEKYAHLCKAQEAILEKTFSFRSGKLGFSLSILLYQIRVTGSID